MALVQRFRYIAAQYFEMDQPSVPQGEFVKTYAEALEQMQAISEDYETFLWGRVVARWYREEDDPCAMPSNAIGEGINVAKEDKVEETANASV